MKSKGKQTKKRRMTSLPMPTPKGRKALLGGPGEGVRLRTPRSR